MSRQKVTLRLNSDVVERAKNAGMNLSYFLEVKLVEYLALLNVTPRRRFELLRGNASRDFQSRNENTVIVSKQQIEEYVSLREIEGLNKGWIKSIERFLLDYVDVINWRVPKDITFEYLNKIGV
jgi:hypothetical protein